MHFLNKTLTLHNYKHAEYVNAVGTESFLKQAILFALQCSATWRLSWYFANRQ